MKTIAGLIYDSDPFIYPAMFKNRQEAETVIPKMIRAGDQMFRRENLFVALEGTKVVGVLVWMRGPMFWDKKIYEKCGGKAQYIDRVAMEYLNLFTEASPDTASVIRISVQPLRCRREYTHSLFIHCEHVIGDLGLVVGQFLQTDTRKIINTFGGHIDGSFTHLLVGIEKHICNSAHIKEKHSGYADQHDHDNRYDRNEHFRSEGSVL